MSGYSFEDLARGFMKISENAFEMMDETIVSFVYAFGTNLMYKTPKDSGKAVFNWVTAIDMGSLVTRGTPATSLTGENASRKELWTVLNRFSSEVNKTVTISNNLPYIYKLAYEDWARKRKTKPHASPFAMIEQNMAGLNFSVYVGDLFGGLNG